MTKKEKDADIYPHIVFPRHVLCHFYVNFDRNERESYAGNLTVLRRISNEGRLLENSHWDVYLFHVGCKISRLPVRNVREKAVAI